MAHAQDRCLKNVELILGGSIKNAPHDDVLALFILALFNLAAEKSKRRRTKKKTKPKSRKLAKLLYGEVIRRMSKSK